MIKKGVYKIGFLVMIILIVGVICVKVIFPEKNIQPPKVTAPTNQVYSLSDNPKDIARKMILDMYPDQEIVEGASLDCGKVLEKWCIDKGGFDHNPVTVSYNVTLTENAQEKSKRNICFNISKAESKENSLRITTRGNEDFKKHVTDKFIGKDFWFSVSNEQFHMEGSPDTSFKSYIVSQNIAGYTHNMPFKEYFEKIHFN